MSEQEDFRELESFMKDNSVNDVALDDLRLDRQEGALGVKLKNMEFLGYQKSKKGGGPVPPSVCYDLEITKADDERLIGQEIQHRVFKNSDKFWKKDHLNIWTALNPKLPTLALVTQFDQFMIKAIKAGGGPLKDCDCTVTVGRTEPKGEEQKIYPTFDWTPAAA